MTDLTSPTVPVYVSKTGFTNQTHEPALGVVNYGGRLYDPQKARFLSPDPVHGLLGQGLNKYAYARNNPTHFVDPSGFLEGLLPGVLGRARRGSRSAAEHTSAPRSTTDPWGWGPTRAGLRPVRNGPDGSQPRRNSTGAGCHKRQLAETGYTRRRRHRELVARAHSATLRGFNGRSSDFLRTCARFRDAGSPAPHKHGRDGKQCARRHRRGRGYSQ